MRASARRTSARRTGLALGNGRHASIAALANLDVERDAAEVLELIALREALAAAAAEDLGCLAAMRADEELMFSTMPMTGTLMRRNMASALATSSSGHVLGGRDEQRAADRHRLGQGQLGVRCAGRQVDHEVVELAPVDVAQELLDGAAHERPAPDDGLALGHEELDAR